MNLPGNRMVLQSQDANRWTQMKEDIRGATDRSGRKSSASHTRAKKKSILDAASQSRGDDDQESLDPISLDPASQDPERRLRSASRKSLSRYSKSGQGGPQAQQQSKQRASTSMSRKLSRSGTQKSRTSGQALNIEDQDPAGARRSTISQQQEAQSQRPSQKSRVAEDRDPGHQSSEVPVTKKPTNLEIDVDEEDRD